MLEAQHRFVRGADVLRLELAGRDLREEVRVQWRFAGYRTRFLIGNGIIWAQEP